MRKDREIHMHVRVGGACNALRCPCLAAVPPGLFLVHPPRHTRHTHRQARRPFNDTCIQTLFTIKKIVNVNATSSKKTCYLNIQALHLRIIYSFRPEINLIWDNKHKFFFTRWQSSSSTCSRTLNGWKKYTTKMTGEKHTKDYLLVKC